MALHFRIGDSHPELARLAHSCWRKQRHASQASAEAQLRSIVRRGLEKDARRIHTYFHAECGGWHVGHGDGRDV